MTKAVKKYDLVFVKDEIKLVRKAYDTAIEVIARKHFLDKGMTEEEIEQKIKFGYLWEEVSFPELHGVMRYRIDGISIEIEELVD